MGSAVLYSSVPAGPYVCSGGSDSTNGQRPAGTVLLISGSPVLEPPPRERLVRPASRLFRSLS
jgi:hypothetical protein